MLVIEDEYQKEKSEDDYVGTFPWNNYAGFGPKVIAKSIQSEKELSSATGLAVLDRSLIDAVAYARIKDCKHLLPDLYDQIKTAQYRKAFFCEFVGSLSERSYSIGMVRKSFDSGSQKLSPIISIS